MIQAKKTVKTQGFNQDGGVSLEYALIALLIAVAVVVSVATMGQQVQDTFCTLLTKIDSSCISQTTT